MKDPVIRLILFTFTLLLIDSWFNTYYIMRHQNEMELRIAQLILAATQVSK